ncbi:hypothetical protein BH23BAC1_BH23BAC1_16180 [soil metagenome]
MKSLTTYSICLLLLVNASFAQDSVQVITSWIQENAIPLKHVEAGNGFADLQPLKQVLKDVKVVGLGEATHGTREFFQIKHRLLEFLVKEMGYSGFAIEASYAACQPINNYILYGKGEIENVLTGQGYVVWDTQELAEMVDWLRAYNKTVSEEKKVKFYGLDLSNNDYGRKAILSYLKKVDSGKVKSTDSLFQVLAREEVKWPMQIDAETEKTLQHIMPRLLNLIDYLTANKERFVNSSSTAEFDLILKYAGIMKQWIHCKIFIHCRKSHIFNRPGKLDKIR